jgi:hypothetical protein
MKTTETKIVYILIGSRRRVGKDTFANLLCKEITSAGCPAVAHSFAGPLKDDVNGMLAATGGWPIALDAWTQNEEEKEKVIRPLLIAYGNARRHYDEGYWVHRLVANAENSRGTYLALAGEEPKPYLFVVVSDWRFPNEIEFLRRQLLPGSGNHTCAVFGVHLSRSTAPTGTPDEIVNDPLCRGLADLFVANEGGLPELQSQAKTIFRHMILNTLYFSK